VEIIQGILMFSRKMKSICIEGQLEIFYCWNSRRMRKNKRRKANGTRLKKMKNKNRKLKKSLGKGPQLRRNLFPKIQGRRNK
jgi:hypothetical protein